MEKKKIFLYVIISAFFAGNLSLFASGGVDRYGTNLNSNILRSHWDTINLEDDREGIYIQSNGGNNPYVLAIVRDNRDDYDYMAIYLSGPGSPPEWEEGHIKGQFRQSGDEYRGTWFSRSGIYGENARLVFGNSMFTLTEGTFIVDTHYYTKIYPYARGFARERGRTGTGFLLNNEGYVITNQHVIVNGSHILVRGINGDFNRAYPFTAVLVDEQNDIAVLKPAVSFLTFTDPPYAFPIDEMRTGSNVFAFGYPWRSVMGDEIKLTNGIISAVSGYRGGIHAYQTTASLTGGNSGGPLFNEDGDIIGINYAGLSATDANNVNYAIKIRYLHNLINSSSLQINIPTSKSSLSKWFSDSNFSLTELTELVKNYVYMIEVF